MDKKFLNKVVDQIVNETRIDYNKEKVYFPFPLENPFSSLSYYSLPLSSLSSLSNYYFSFSDHCKNVYGLNENTSFYDEIDYVWEEYIKILKDKIESNGL